MSRRLPLLMAALCLALSTACGSDPEAGDSCSVGEGYCQSSSEALVCDGGSLKLLNCRGANGCSKDDDGDATCTFGDFRAGDPCLSTQENAAQCDASNANQLLRCSGGSMKAEACKGCAVQSGTITCQP
ncbi:hypothetical protein [Hyalangium gracile]|uniref:hypothetical protein n=1 Tax=Hyalangium gracile TaxID=394092 RepID=UPI001CCF1667|nr:hypothetical protein [Hyalangium gracile]